MIIIDLDKKDLLWLQKALNKKGYRPFETQILAKDGIVYATNGHVLHILSSDKVTNGKYNFKGELIIGDESIHPLENNPSRLIEGHINECSLSVSTDNLNQFNLDDNRAVSKEYFYNAVDKANNIELKLKENGVLVSYENRKAVIMCINRSR